MEMMITFLTSKIFIAFVILVVAYNMVRRYNKGSQRRSSRARRRLKDHIRERQAEQWDGNEQERND